MDGIYVKFAGGLGNKMFQMAAGYAASRKYKAPLYYPDEDHTNHHGIVVNYSKTIFKYIGTSQLRMNYPIHRINRPVITTEAYSNDSLRLPITFDHYFQYYPPLEPYEKELRELFKRHLTTYTIDFPHLENAAFIHIRRGDYLQHTDNHPITPRSHYEHAIQELKDRVKIFYVFSDDMNWVQQQDLFQSEQMVCIYSDDELYTLAFMSRCLGGSICANSTFSWWGAFLGAYEVRNPVFVPKDWIRNRVVGGLFPKEWIVR